SSRPHPQAIEVASPVFGDGQAPVEVVLFEDFKCYGCHTFAETVLPRIEAEYLAPQRIRLKLIPLGFLQGSKMLANAALEVYQLAPERFFSYAKLLFKRFEDVEVDEYTPRVLLDLAREVGGIDLNKLQLCIEQKCHYSEVERNLDQARALMGKKFRIPALYINGVRVNTTDYEAIRQQIEKAQP
ncbi:MAG TPA: thioredoxin domain-containing protein, partial [Chlamydiales bacterium]|nr:thioredoxin domain-containing protein [Chlamydiales bacterium]